MIAAPALCAESAPAAALSVRGMSTTRDVSYNVVGTFVGSVAGVAPSCSPSPLVDPHANGNLASTGVSVDVSGAHTLDSLRNTAPLSSGVVGMSSSKVEEDDEVLGEADSASPYARPTHPYHLDVHDPPAYARRQFGELFGGVDKSITSGMSMITVAMRSKLDMATWSSDIVAEREVLLKEFHALAARAVENLRAAGFWADYIDPSSGKAHYAATSSGSFLETDDRLAMYGYRVLDYGCCKAISHPEWGTHVMVGVVFTNAPTEIVKRLAAVVTKDSPPLTCLVTPPTGPTHNQDVAPSAAVPSK